MIRIIHSDLLKWLSDYQHIVQRGYMPKYHAVLCDPPYYLGSIVKRFGAENSAPAQHGSDGRFQRLGSGFMGKTWDGFASVQDYQAWVTEWASMLLDFVYPGAVMMAFGGCYDSETEILTEAGWKYFYDLTTLDRFATLNQDTHEIEYHHAKELVTLPYKGRMYRLETNKVDLLVTEDHWMYTAPVNKKSIADYQRIQAKNIAFKHVQFIKDGIWSGETPEYFILPSCEQRKGNPTSAIERVPTMRIDTKIWVAFMGLWLAEGSASITKARTGRGYNISLAHFDIDNLNELSDLLSPYFDCKIYPDIGKMRINNRQLCEYLQQFGHAPDKFIPAFIKSLSPELIRIFLDWYIRGDGENERYRIYTCSKRMADDLQELALKAGWSADIRCRIRETSGNIDGREIIPQHPEYCIAINRTQNKPHKNPNRVKTECWIDMDTTVYCVEVPNNVIYVRRNGKAVWCGNTRTYHRLVCGLEDAGWEIYDSIMAWTYGCLPETDEILTRDGWRLGKDIQVGDVVMAWDSETETLTLTEVQEKYLAPYKGDMVLFKNDNTDQMLTPNHRVYHKSSYRIQVDGVRTRYMPEEWNVSEAKDIKRYGATDFPLAGYHDGNGVGGEDYAALLGWMFTEGGFDNNGNGVRLTQSSVNQSHVDEMRDLLTRLDIPFKEYSRVRQYKQREYTEYTFFWTGDYALKLRDDLPDKHPTYDLLWRMSQDEKLAFYDAAMKGDGSTKKGTNVAFYQKDLADLEWFQALAHCIGWQGRINEKKYCVSLHDNPKTQLQSRHYKANETEYYDGDVWCVRVKTGAFVARRNGRIFITGNSGFPKSHDISKAIDNAAGVEREKGQLRTDGRGKWELKMNRQSGDTGVGHADGSRQVYHETLPATPLAEQWNGYGTALKPSYEPIVLARAPRQGYTYADCATKFGSGALNIDGCRIAVDDNDPNHRRDTGGYKIENNEPRHIFGQNLYNRTREATLTKGRFPANTMLVHHPDCTDDTCHPDCHVRVLGEQSGYSSESRTEIKCYQGAGSGLLYGDYSNRETSPAHNDSGTAARFFYQAKSSNFERIAGLPDGTRNPHPTVKPIQLITEIAKLIKPPIEDARLLVPFAGSGSEMIGAYLAGWKHITGIEMTDEYIPIARARLAWWQRFDSYAMAENYYKNHDDSQMTMFEFMDNS